MLEFTNDLLHFIRYHTVLFLTTISLVLATVFFGWVLFKTHTAETPADVIGAIPIPQGAVIMKASEIVISDAISISEEDWQKKFSSLEPAEHSRTFVVFGKDTNGNLVDVRWVLSKSDGISYVATRSVKDLFVEAHGFWIADYRYSREDNRLDFVPEKHFGARFGLWIIFFVCAFFSFFLLMGCKEEW